MKNLKRILCLLLVCVLMGSLLPMTAAAEDIKITAMEFTVENLAIGEKGTALKAHVAGDQPITLNNLATLRYDDAGEPGLLVKSDLLQEGKIYWLCINPVVKSGYSLTPYVMLQKESWTINGLPYGMAIDKVVQSGSQVRFRLTPLLKAIDTLSITGVPAPKYGQKVKEYYEDPLEDYDVSAITAGIEDYVIMTENETHWYIHLGGRGEEIDLDTEDALREVYDVAETYVGGVEDFLYAAAELFPPAAEAPAEDVPAAIKDAEEYLVFDEADLLSDAEEAALQEKLLGISHSHNAQIVVITIATLNGGEVDGFLNHIYDSMEFGYGENHDGVLLLVCMDPREFRILSNGLAADAISAFDIEVISEMIKTDLSDGDYADAFNTFADQCDEYLGDQTTMNHTVEILGDKVYILTEMEKKMRQYTMAEGTLTLDKVIELDTEYTAVESANGELVLSRAPGVPVIFHDGESVTKSYDGTAKLMLAPDGTWGISSISSGEKAEKITFTEEGMTKESFPFNEVKQVRYFNIDDKYIYVAGIPVDSNDHTVFVYNHKGELQMTLGAEPDGKFKLGSITYVARSANGFVGVDANFRDLVLWAKDGTWLGSIDGNELFGTSYPWIMNADVMDDGSLLVIMSEERADHSAIEILAYKVSVS